MKSLSFLFVFFVSTTWAQPFVKIDTLIDFTKEDSLALFIEIDILEKIIQNDLFWKEIEKYDFGCRNRRIYHSKRSRSAGYPKLKKDKHNYTNTEIINLIKIGADEIGETNDSTLNFKLKAKTYEKNSNSKVTHGSTNKNTLIITSNRETRVNSSKTGAYACHLLHEYMHVLGFKHKSNSPSKNKNYCGGIDVPLGIQKIAQKVLKSLK